MPRSDNDSVPSQSVTALDYHPRLPVLVTITCNHSRFTITGYHPQLQSSAAPVAIPATITGFNLRLHRSPFLATIPSYHHLLVVTIPGNRSELSRAHRLQGVQIRLLWRVSGTTGAKRPPTHAEK